MKKSAIVIRDKKTKFYRANWAGWVWQLSLYKVNQKTIVKSVDRPFFLVYMPLHEKAFYSLDLQIYSGL